MNNKFHSLFLLLTSLLLLFASCSRHFAKLNETNKAVIYPPPPDTARIQFLTSISGSNDVGGKQSSFSKFIAGEVEQKTIEKPYGVTIHGGKIYVCDLTLSGLVIIDLKNSQLDFFIPKGQGRLKLPVNCSVDEEGFLYVADGGRGKVLVFNPQGEYVSAIQEKENFNPSEVVVTKDKVWVINSTSKKIQVYQKDTAHINFPLLYSFPNAKSGDKEHLHLPTNMFVRNDKVYVSDFFGFNVKIFKQDGTYLSSVGSLGKGFGQFSRPKGVAVDRDENLFVVDAAFENVQIFNNKGQLLLFFGGPYKGPGDMWLPAKVDIDYDNLKYFQKYVDKRFNLKYLILVSNQFGPDKINIYGAVELKN